MSMRFPNAIATASTAPTSFGGRAAVDALWGVWLHALGRGG